MKRILFTLVLLALALSLTACSAGESKNIAGELPELMNKLLTSVDLDAETKEWLATGLMQTEVTAENTEYYLGKSDYTFSAALAAEPMMSAQALSVVLIRAEDAAAAQKLAEEVPTTADPRKWICVGVEPSDVKGASIGDLAILVMAENSQKYIDAFNALAQ